MKIKILEWLYLNLMKFLSLCDACEMYFVIMISMA